FEVGSQLSGQVLELFADFSATVKQGQPIAQLEFRPAGIVASSSAQLRPDNATYGMPVTLWVLDSKGSPTPVRVRIGEGDRRATEIVAGSISRRRDRPVSVRTAP